MFSAKDWMQTLLGAAGETRPQSRNCQQGPAFSAKSFKVLLDSYDQRNLLLASKPYGGAHCQEFFYWTDDGGLAGLRYDKWKLAFMEQRILTASISGRIRW